MRSMEIPSSPANKDMEDVKMRTDFYRDIDDLVGVGISLKLEKGKLEDWKRMKLPDEVLKSEIKIRQLTEENKVKREAVIVKYAGSFPELVTKINPESFSLSDVEDVLSKFENTYYKNVSKEDLDYLVGREGDIKK